MESKFGLDPDYLYSMKELSFRLNRSREWVRRRFRKEPGVIRTQEVPTPGRREYCPLLIPGRVALRVLTRMTVVDPRQ
jgi:hypothetical protein